MCLLLITHSYRENTLRSCQKAAEAGATFVEFDLQVTKDGVVVLWHDDLVRAVCACVSVCVCLCVLQREQASAS